ncbi:MAG: class D sortase [Clostridia bacterium]|nr:class D sortase [Clostridia bacterium]
MLKSKKNKTDFVKATISNIIVAFIYVAVFCFFIYYVFSSKISMAMGILDTISIDTSKKILKDVTIDLETRNLKAYPEFGTRYGTISLPSLGLTLDFYFGDSLEVLRNGVGQSGGGYFPGEGGSIITMGHNYSGILKTLPEIKSGDTIILDVNYGKFTYEVYDTKIVYYTETYKLPIQRDEEILMLYTCYPTDGFGHAVDRYVVYSRLVEEEIYD